MEPDGGPRAAPPQLSGREVLAFWPAGLGLVALLVLIAHVVSGAPDAGVADEAIDHYLPAAIAGGGAVALLLAARWDRKLRPALLALGAGAAAIGASWIEASFSGGGGETLPGELLGDPLRLVGLAGVAVGMLLAVRALHPGPDLGMVLDTLVAALMTAAVAAAVVASTAVVHQQGLDSAVGALALPVAASTLTLLGLRATLGLGRPVPPLMATLTLGLGLLTTAEWLPLLAELVPSVVAHAAVDVIRPAAVLVIAAAPYLPEADEDLEGVERGFPLVAVPGVAAVVSVALLTYGNVRDLPGAAVLLTVATLLAVIGRMVLTFRDNARLSSGWRDATSRASTDALTGLANRGALEECLAAEVRRAQRHVRSLSLIVMDLDHFKQVNDTHGHPAGDAVLREVARRLGRLARVDDTLARAGGEEFVWLLPETGLGAARHAAERARAAVNAAPFPAAGNLTISCGVATLGLGDGPLELYGRADAALYAAKNAGRDRVVALAATRSEAADDQTSSTENVSQLFGSPPSNPR